MQSLGICCLQVAAAASQAGHNWALASMLQASYSNAVAAGATLALNNVVFALSQHVRDVLAAAQATLCCACLNMTVCFGRFVSVEGVCVLLGPSRGWMLTLTTLTPRSTVSWWCLT